MTVMMSKISPIRLGAPFGFDMDLAMAPAPQFPGPGGLDIAAPPAAPGPDAGPAPEGVEGFETFPVYPYQLEPQRVYVTQEEKPAVVVPDAAATSNAESIKTGIWIAGGLLAVLVVANIVMAGKK